MDDLDLGATIKGFSPGQKVFNRYTLQKILGRGGMGVVWLARDGELERDVALKFLPEIVALDRESVTELKRETRRNLELTHPHIVRIYDFVQDARAAAISMEFINGASLSGLKVDRPGGIFPQADVTRWASQLCEALSYAHGSAKVVHRDLKPANLMITTEGDLKITDFGIACSIADSVSRVSKNMDSSGTPLYMSPQQMMGDRPTAADDIYSFGATFYELLAGKPPFYTGNIILQVQNKQPPTMTERRQELHITAGDPIPAEWETAIAACLAKDPAQRPPSIAAVAERLKLSGAFTAHVPVATPVAPPPPAPAAKAEPVPPPAAKPAPEPAAVPPAPAKSGSKKALWLGLAAGLVVLGGVGFWLGDVPARLKAGERMAEAQKALFASDWQTALLALRESVNLRPTDLEYRREFDEAQRRWIDMVEKEITDVAAPTAYDRLTARAPAAVALVEPYSETFRRLSDQTGRAVRELLQGAVTRAQELAASGEFDEALAVLGRMRSHESLLPSFAPAERAIRLARAEAAIETARLESGERNFYAAFAALNKVAEDAGLTGGAHAATLQAVREAEVRAQLEQVLAMAGADRYGEAQTELERLAQGGILPDAVKATAAEVRQLAQEYSIARLSRALIAQQAAEADAAIEDYARFSGSQFNVTGSALIATRELPAFLSAIEELRMRPAAGQPRTHGVDIALVAAVRDRFTNAGAVTDFLRQEFTAWSAVEEEGGRPGLALFLAAEAVREGAPADPARESRLRAQLAADVGLRLAWAPHDVDARAVGPLRTEPFNALRAALERRVAPVMQTGDAGGSATLTVALALSGPTDSNQPSRQQRSVRYQSGTRTVDNPAYGRLQSQLNYAQDEVNRAQRALEDVRAYANSQAQSTSDSTSLMAVAIAGGIGVGVAQNNLNKAVNNRNNIRDNLRNTSRTLTEPTYADEPYDVITHNVTYAAELAAAPQGGRNPVRWRAQLAHQTTEVTGNASRGVPVQRPTYPAAAEISRQLAQQLGERVRDIGALEKMLATASFAVVADRGRQDGREADDVADDQWGLLLLWRSIKVEPEGAAAIEDGVRQALGLPRR